MECAADGPAHLLSFDQQAMLAQHIRETSIIALADVEIAAFVQKLRPAGHADVDAMFKDVQFISGAEKSGQAGIHKHGGLFGGFGGVDRGIRQHGMEQAADPCDRIVDRHTDARAERIGGQHHALIVGDRQTSDAHDQFPLKTRKTS